MNNSQFNDLLQRYLNDSITAEELRILRELLLKGDNDELLQSAIVKSLSSNAFAELSEKDKANILFQNIMQRAKESEDIVVTGVGKTGVVKRINFWRAAVAALITIATATAIYQLINHRQAVAPIAQKPVQLQNDVPPGTDKAILTLADGSTILLDSTVNDTLATQGNAAITLQDKGLLTYVPLNDVKDKVLYNTISTPRGGQFQITLPDGTNVWMNAASSLRFPTSFTGSDRVVELSGEAYFEVAKNQALPFKVIAEGTEVRVLGTHFNINAYTDETSVNTTLLEGSVMVTKNGKQVTIQPGQQARAKDDIEVADNVDTETLMAWKNGRFSFNKTSLETLMRSVARWYDVTVVFEDRIQDTYSVDISRNLPVSKLLQFLELSGGVHFSIEGKKIICKKIK